MKKETAIKIFEQKQIRTLWDDDEEKWYFSIVDIVSILTEQEDFQKARKYWNKLRERLKKEGNETVTNCHRLKMVAADGKMRFTDVADTEQIFMLIQSVPSKKVEPFKLSGRPLHSSAAEKMEMKVIDFLSAVITAVKYQTETIF